MGKLLTGLAIVLAATPGAALAQDFLPAGTYDCTKQLAGEMKLTEIGVLKVTPEGFSGPAAEDADAPLFV